MTCEDSSNPYLTSPCAEVLEDHARHVVVHQYVACVRILDNWVIPTADALAWLSVPALVDALVGCCIWNPTYGYFRVTAFDMNAQKIQVQRVETEGALPAGTVINPCTKFIFTQDV